MADTGAGCIYLLEQTDYEIFAESVAGPIELRHEDRELLRFVNYKRAGTLAYGVINFGGNVGRSAFDVIVDGLLELSFTVEVFPSKLDYKDDYGRLLNEVSTMSFGLALEFLRPTYRRGAVVQRRGATAEWLSLLTALITDLERAVRQIERRPHRSLTAEEATVRTHRIRRADSFTRQRLLGADVHALPSVVRASQRRPSLRNPEHAWIAAKLESAAWGVNLLIRGARELPQAGHRAAQIDVLQSLGVRIARLRRAEPIAAAIDLPVPNFASFQLMRLPGYREAYITLLTLQLGLGMDGDALKLSTKELHVLYEYWCFLAVLRALSAQLETRPELENLFDVTSGGLSLSLRRGSESKARYTHKGRRIEVTYNPLFTDGLLTSQRPDITVAIEESGWPPVLMILDAKYQLDASPAYVRRYGSPGPPDEAINALHRYRDAVLEPGAAVPLRFKRAVVQGAALFPLAEAEVGSYGRSALWKSITTLGIGAIPALPSNTRYLEEWIHSVLARSGWQTSDLAIGHLASEQAMRLRHAAEEPVLIARLGPGATADLAVAALDDSDELGHLLRVRRILVATQQGAGDWEVRTEATLEAITATRSEAMFRVTRFKPRTSIRWRNVDFPLKLPILTTALAASRATTAPELLLRTELDWRLREQLAALGLEVQLDIDPAAGLMPQPMWLLGAHRQRARRDTDGSLLIAQRGGGEIRIEAIEDVLSALAELSVMQGR